MPCVIVVSEGTWLYSGLENTEVCWATGSKDTGKRAGYFTASEPDGAENSLREALMRRRLPSIADSIDVTNDGTRLEGDPDYDDMDTFFSL